MSAGEISPLLFGRPDYQRVQTGLKTCRGFLPMRQGGVTRAPGTLWKGNSKSDSAGILVAFEFAVNDAVVLEFTPNLMRVWRYGELVLSGGTPYELATPFGAAELALLQFTQSADAIYMVDGTNPLQKLTRTALDNWAIDDAPIDTGPFQTQNLDEAITIQASAETGTGITLTGTGTSFTSDMIGSLLSLRTTDDDTVPEWTGNTTAAVNDPMRYDGNTYKLTAGTNTGVNPPTHLTGEVLVDKTQGTKWLFVSDGHGIVRITGVTSTTSATADVLKRVPVGCVANATYRWAEGAWSEKNGYPRAITQQDNRLLAANSTASPRTVWYSLLGVPENFEPTDDVDAAFSPKIDGNGSQNEIIWLKGGARGLHVGALGEIYSSTSLNENEAVSALNIAFRKDAEIGSASATPIAPSGKPIFIARDKKRLFEIEFSFSQDKNEPLELSLPAEHIAGEGMEEIVWQDGLAPTAWIRRSNGELAAMIYDPAEQVLGWATIPVAGELESMCVTKNAAGTDDVVTLMVKRTIDGAIERHIEEIAPTFGLLPASVEAKDAVHLYGAILFTPGSATDTFTGLDHLEGEDVYAWTDEGEMGPVTVAGGSVTLDGVVNQALIGKSEDTDQSIRTLDVVSAAQDGATMGRQKRLTTVGVRLHRTAAALARSISLEFGKDDRPTPLKDITGGTVPVDTTTAFSGIVNAALPTGYNKEVEYEFRPLGGAPLTILGLVPILDTEDR